MLQGTVNEITVFLDQQEDEGIDTSLLRTLCIYNYLSNFLMSGLFFADRQNFGDGASHGEGYSYSLLNGHGYGIGSGRGNGYYHEDENEL